MEFILFVIIVLSPIGLLCRPIWRKLNDQTLDSIDTAYLAVSAVLFIFGAIITWVDAFPFSLLAYLPIVLLLSGFSGSILFVIAMAKQFFEETGGDESYLHRMRGQVERACRLIPEDQFADERAYLETLVNKKVPELFERRRAIRIELEQAQDALDSHEVDYRSIDDLGLARARLDLIERELWQTEAFLDSVETHILIAKGAQDSPLNLPGLHASFLSEKPKPAPSEKIGSLESEQPTV